MKRLVHMAMVYVCRSCGEVRTMFVEKGLEENCNLKLKNPSGLPHKPTPYCIKCPKCGELNMCDTGNYNYSPEFIEASPNWNLFINSEEHDCGQAVFHEVEECAK